MQFAYLAVLCCTIWTLVSALPLVPLGFEIIPRGSDNRIDYHSLYARGGPIRTPRKKFQAAVNTVLATTKTAPIPHQVSLKQSRPGTAQEHWALHFHPTEAGRGDLHVLHAVSDNDPQKNGVLQVEHLNKGTYNPSQGSTSHPIAQFPSRAKAMAAMRDVRDNIQLNHPFPQHNCVDFTCSAVQHMAANNHIPQAAADAFQQHHDAHSETVRATTNTDANRKAAGVAPQSNN